jgi:hypothetical protein
MHCSEFINSEIEEIQRTEGYYSQDGWGQQVWVSKESAQAEKRMEIRARHERQKIADKAREFGCDFEIQQSMAHPGAIRISCDKETTPGGFEKFVGWYRENILPVAIELEVIS